MVGRKLTNPPLTQENYRMGSAYKWPLVSEVLEYRQKVREMVIDTIENSPLQLPITRDHPWVCLFCVFVFTPSKCKESAIVSRKVLYTANFITFATRNSYC